MSLVCSLEADASPRVVTLPLLLADPGFGAALALQLSTVSPVEQSSVESNLEQNNQQTHHRSSSGAGDPPTGVEAAAYTGDVAVAR